MNTAIVIVSILLAIGAISCDQKAGERGGSTSSTPVISVQQLNKLVTNEQDIFLLDVRTEPEVITSRLAFTDMRIAYDSLNILRSQLPQDKNAAIYCFCRTGRRSAIATTYLRSIGYTNVYNVEGGITAWRAAGFTTVSGASHPPDTTL